MFQETLKHYKHIYLNSIGMLLFFAVFVGVLVWISRKSNTEAYKEIERLPMQDAQKGDL